MNTPQSTHASTAAASHTPAEMEALCNANVVARCDAEDERDRLREINAELLAALTALAGYFEVHTMDTGRTPRGEQVLEDARAAIAKATGNA